MAKANRCGLLIVSKSSQTTGELSAHRGRGLNRPGAGDLLRYGGRTLFRFVPEALADPISGKPVLRPAVSVSNLLVTL
jgi:hypothetical protein